MQGRESGIHPISSKTPAPQYQPIERKKRKGKIVEDYSRDRAAHASKITFSLLLKPASPTPPNTGSGRSFQRDTWRWTKVLRYCDVLQRGIAVYRCATRAPHVTHPGTYGPGRVPLSWCNGLHMILYSIHRSTATDRRWEMSHSNTPPVRNRAPLTARSSSLTVEHNAVEQYSKTGRTKPGKHISRSDLSWNTRQDFLKIPNLWEARL